MKTYSSTSQKHYGSISPPNMTKEFANPYNYFWLDFVAPRNIILSPLPLLIVRFITPSPSSVPPMQLVGIRLAYFKSPFNIFDFLLLILAWIDVILEALSISDAIRSFAFLRIFRIVRSIKLFRVCNPL